MLDLLSECLQEVQRQRAKHQREESARIFLSNEDPTKAMNLTNTLKKLNADKQPLIYYIGGLDLLCQLINDGLLRQSKSQANPVCVFRNNSNSISC